MPPQRTPMGVISGNRQKGKHLTPDMRGKIVGLSLFGSSPTEVAVGLNIEHSTVRYTLSTDSLRHEGSSQPKDPRRKSYSLAEERKLLRHIRLHPKDTYKQVRVACALTCSTTTIKRILKIHGITNWRCKRRPLLTEVHAAKRLAWCLAHRYWNKETWGMVVWSDEYSVEQGRGKRDEWVFRTPAQKWDREMVQTYGMNKNMKTMVWGAF
jgi:hypothetical protein